MSANQDPKTSKPRKRKFRKWIRRILYSLLALLMLLAMGVWYYYPGASVAREKTDIPFTFDRDIIMIQGMLNGSGPYNFVLDTGTDPSVVDLSLSKEIALFHVSLGDQDVGEDQLVSIEVPTPLKLKVGDLPASRKMFLALDLTEISDKLGTPVHGILGYNFIRDNILQIKYSERTLSFFPFGEGPQNTNAPGMPIEFIDDGTFPVLDDVIVNGKPVRISLDTGSNKTLTLFTAGVAHVGLNEALENAALIESVGFGGADESKVVDSISVAVGDHTPRSMTIYCDVFSQKSKVPLSTRGGNMGNKIFQHFTVTFDYEKKRVWFDAN